MSDNNGLTDLFDDLISGRKTVDQVKAELEGAEIYLRAGKNYRPLKFNGFAKVADKAVNVYVAGDKVNSLGGKVVSTPRAQKSISKRK